MGKGLRHAEHAYYLYTTFKRQESKFLLTKQLSVKTLELRKVHRKTLAADKTYEPVFLFELVS